MEVQLTGKQIKIDDLVLVARNRAKLSLSPQVKKKVLLARSAVEKSVNDGKVLYGITTGFGAFKDTAINKEQTEELQEHLILSHAVGVGLSFFIVARFGNTFAIASN